MRRTDATEAPTGTKPSLPKWRPAEPGAETIKVPLSVASPAGFEPAPPPREGGSTVSRTPRIHCARRLYGLLLLAYERWQAVAVWCRPWRSCGLLHNQLRIEFQSKTVPVRSSTPTGT
jgi:hypothetical protein